MRKVPVKNYLILLVVGVLVVVLTFYLAEWYKTLKEYYQNNSVVAELLAKIESETISSYILDNNSFILYISSSSDQEVKKFEKKFKKYITENDLRDEIVYFDALNLDDEYIDELFIQYTGKPLKKLKNIVSPNLIFFENGEIMDILYVKENDITISDVKKFIERNSVIIND